MMTIVLMDGCNDDGDNPYDDDDDEEQDYFELWLQVQQSAQGFENPVLWLFRSSFRFI